MKIVESNGMAIEGVVDDAGESLIIGVFGLMSVIITLGSCLWCRLKWTKFKERRNLGHQNHINISALQHNPVLSVQPNMQLTSVSTLSAAILDEIIFEPLPEIRSRSIQAVAQNIRPARFPRLSENTSLQDWFDEQQVNFPRNQLKYLKEVGSAWYGQAVVGEAYNMQTWEEKTQVVVKILRVDATVLEYMQFLNETRALRDLQHPHLLRLMGRCLEVHPFLLIMEHCYIDLKTYLIQQRKSSENFLKDGLALRMSCDIASAIQYIHEHGYTHCDIACHSCLITSNRIVKIGDYGTALFVHKSDYYCLGDIAFPLRWCAPESLHCNESIIEAKGITREANVWSFGVLLWELLEFGKLPYIDYTDDEVVQKVIIEYTLRLEQPKISCIHKDMMFNIMQLCWLPSSHRPPMQKVLTLLNYLYENRDDFSDSAAFESRWDALQPVFKNHNIAYANVTTLSLKFESDFNSKVDFGFPQDCDSIMSSEFSPSQHGDKSPSRCSFSTGYECELSAEISPSLQNLHGSVEDFPIVSSSTNKESDMEHSKRCDDADDSIVIEAITKEPINDLDSILAGEITSSETSKCTIPEKGPDNGFQTSEPNISTATVCVNLVNGGKVEYGNVLNENAVFPQLIKNVEINSNIPFFSPPPSNFKQIKDAKYESDSDLGFASS